MKLQSGELVSSSLDDYESGDTIMANKDTARRQQMVARIKSAVATAAIVGTLGGWMAFGTQQSTEMAAVSTDTPAVAQVASANTSSSAVQVPQSSGTTTTTSGTTSTSGTTASAADTSAAT